ncbi:hypothetical protein GTP81_13380 [Rugamonas sp. FT107W]|uniref:Uncharacterized protein n=1 Tax=Duganella vulcania TaxID=2692166 RepID=A0A845HGE8_9BURK|nr:hypothetical protein [Duganella vulcania]MYN17748.1 hypothetical protein [Duganella vulcania]
MEIPLKLTTDAEKAEIKGMIQSLWRSGIHYVADPPTWPRPFQCISKTLIFYLRSGSDLQMENGIGHGSTWNGFVKVVIQGVTMRLRLPTSALLLLTAGSWLAPAHGANAIALEQVEWPARASCTGCTSLQFGMLEIQLPPALIGKVFIPASMGSSVHLIPPDGDARHDVVLACMPADELAGKYGQKLSAHQFLNQLGRPAADADPWGKIKKVEGLDNAVRYTHAARDKVHAYWIQSTPPNSQYAYLVVDNAPDVYSLSGALTPELYAAILANLRLAPAP